MRKSLLVLAVLVGLSGCGGDGVGDAADVFEDGTYTVVSIGVDGALVPLVAGHEPTMVFEDGRLSGNNSCNTYGGIALIGDDGNFSVNDVFQTEMYCEETAEVEAAFTAALLRVDSWEMVGDELVLAASDGSAEIRLRRS